MVGDMLRRVALIVCIGAAPVLEPPPPGTSRAELSASADGPATPPDLRDIVTTRSIDGLAVSPDRRHVAYRVVEPSLRDNRQTLRWFTVPLDAATPPIPLGVASDPVWDPLFGFIDPGTAVWSRDSRSIWAATKRAGAVQLRRLLPQGRDIAATDDAADIVSFAATPDGNGLVYQTRDDRAAILAAQEAESRRGVHIDRTVITNGLRLDRSLQTGGPAVTIRRTADGAQVAFTGTMRDHPLDLSGLAPGDRPAAATDGMAAMIVTDTPDHAGHRLRFARFGISIGLRQLTQPSPVLGHVRYRLEATLPGGQIRHCRAAFCEDTSTAIHEISLDERSGEVVILYEPGLSGRASVYGWNPRSGRIRRIIDAGGALDGDGSPGIFTSTGFRPCPVVDGSLICVFQGPIRPPELVRIDPATARMTTLADPNAALSLRAFPAARALQWPDRDGRVTNGILVLPERHDRPVPLVITTYRCRGFLRGGIGWLAPEELLAERGIAALCVDNNNSLYDDPAIRSTPLGMHKASIASYAAIIERLAKAGVIDPARVGIAGHSYSDLVIAYAISHSTLFSAVVMGSGFSLDPATLRMTAPTADSWREQLATANGLPLPEHDPARVWDDVSPVANVAKIRAAVLMQPPEDEWRYGIQLFSALQHEGGAADMFVYPDEGHSASEQPEHQYWRDLRSLDWFSFWLQDREYRTADTAAMYDHWETLRRERSHSAGPAG